MIRRLLLMIVVVAGTAPVLGGGAAPPVLVADGVTIAGVPVGGMSFEQAEAAVTPAFDRPIRLVLGPTRMKVSPAHFGMSVAVADGVGRAFDAEPRAAVELVPEIDAAAVQGFVRGLEKRFSYPAKDAELTGIVDLVPHFSNASVGR